MRIVWSIFAISCFGISACKPRIDTTSQVKEAQQPPNNLLPIANWDWGVQAPLLNQLVKNSQLTYCVDQQILDLLRDAFELAASKINAAGTGWTLNPAPIGLCAANWPRLAPGQKPQMIGNIRVRMAPLPLGAQGGQGDMPFDPPYQDEADYLPVPEPGAPPRGGGGGGQAGILAVFRRIGFIQQPAVLEFGEIVFNSAASWTLDARLNGFDPREVAMHEVGHALRLEHESYQYSDDQTLVSIGSINPNKPAPNLILVGPGANEKMDSALIGDDALDANNNIVSGPNGVAESGVMRNIMEPMAIYNQHGANPQNIQIPGANFNYAPRELAALVLSAQ